MPTIERGSGLRVSLPNGYQIAAAPSTEVPPSTDPTAARRRSATRRAPAAVPMPATPGPSAIPDEAARIARALARENLEWVDTIPVEPAPAPAPPGVRRAPEGPPAEATVEVQVDLSPDEGAAVLVEQDGLYAWHFESSTITSVVPDTPVAPGIRRRGALPQGRTAVFRITLSPRAKPGPRQRGFLSDLIVGRAQALVFRFAGRFLLAQATVALERSVEPGFVVMDGDDPMAWRHIPELNSVSLPADRPARILLFVHGTFSSTRGGYGGLGATPWGRSFLAAARGAYDVILGFDHPTLGVDPLANARELLRLLQAHTWSQPATVDAICHSRGGITLRSLLEHLLPGAQLPVRFERVVFAGAVNSGTELATPENWRALIDLYTNLSAAACRAIALFPGAVFASTLIEEMVRSLGTFAKVLAREAITERGIPGLAAMEPRGPFIQDLNQTQTGQPTPTQSRYYAITSEFRARLALDRPGELPRQLLLALADGMIDQLMGEANDLVVNTASMTAIDPHAGSFFKDVLAFPPNGVVYHTNYFLQPQVANALARWFELDLPAADPQVRAASRDTVRSTPGPIVPACIDTDVLAMPASDLGCEIVGLLNQRAPSYVVVEREYRSGRLRYAFQTEEVIGAIKNRPDASLQVALDLHEIDASPCGTIGTFQMPCPNTFHGTRGRYIAVDGDRIIGVAESTLTPSPMLELSGLSQRVANPSTPVDRVLARRSLPTFTSRSPLNLLIQTARTFLPLPGGFGSDVVDNGSPPLPPAPEPPPVRRRGLDSRTKKMEPPAAPPEAAPVDTRVTCHFQAAMDDEVIVGETASVDFTMSREGIAAVVGRAVADTTVPVEAGRKLIIDLIPRRNVTAAGETRLDVDIPAVGRSETFVFDVLATDAGPGEILVRVRQGSRPIAQLTLQFQVVAKRQRPPVRRQQDARTDANVTGRQPLHQLTVFEIERGRKRHYQYILDSPSLGWKHTYESGPITGDRAAYVKAIYEDIEKRWLTTNSDFDRFQKELRVVGAGLWDELFPAELQRVLWENRERIESILVFSEEPFIPWELVHLKEPGRTLGQKTLFLGQLGLVRWLHNVGWPTETLVARPGRCRYVIPNYPHPNYALPEAAAEAAFLKKSRFAAQAVDPHPEPVQALLEAPGAFDLLHFACHGAADEGDIGRAELLLEGRVEGANYVLERLRATDVEQTANLVGADGTRPMVVLNACQAGRAGYRLTSIGGFARAFLRQGAGAFVGALWSVGDKPARTFTESLYRRLLAGDSLASATNAARAAAGGEREATWLAYTVYGNPHAKLT